MDENNKSWGKLEVQFHKNIVWQGDLFEHKYFYTMLCLAQVKGS